MEDYYSMKENEMNRLDLYLQLVAQHGMWSIDQDKQNLYVVHQRQFD